MAKTLIGRNDKAKSILNIFDEIEGFCDVYNFQFFYNDQAFCGLKLAVNPVLTFRAADIGQQIKDNLQLN